MYLAETQYEEVMESYSYSTSALVSHIGGYMGLLLGASILSFLQILEVILHKVRRGLDWILSFALKILGGNAKCNNP